MKPSSVLACTCALAVLASSPDARAAAPRDDVDAEPSDDPAFRYTTPARADLARAAVEELVVLGVGFAQYASEKEANEVDFDLGYDWPSFRSKLVFDAFSLDNNHYPTNWLTHPLAGFFYYSAARSNRLGILASYGYALASSTIWEYVGEFKEQVSINDEIVTPLTGVALGEPALQLGALFHRARPSFATRALGWVFAPIKSMHDWMDGLTPEPAEEVDDLGMPLDVWHRLELGIASGVTRQSAGGLVQPDLRAFLDSRVVTLPSYGRAGQHAQAFTAGEISTLRTSGTISNGELVDFLLDGGVVAAGYAWQDVHTDPRGGLEGQGINVGLRVGTEYGVHDYDRDRRRAGDRLALVSLGTSVEHSLYVGPFTMRARLDVLGDFAGVDAYALPWYERTRAQLGLPSVVRSHGYYHAYGATIRPVVELGIGAFDAGVDVRVEAFQAINELDREPEPVRGNVVTARDERTQARAWLGVRPVRHLRLSLSADGRERRGSLDDIAASRSEVSLQLGASGLF